MEIVQNPTKLPKTVDVILANGKRVDDTHTHIAQGANAVTTPPN